MSLLDLTNSQFLVLQLILGIPLFIWIVYTIGFMSGRPVFKTCSYIVITIALSWGFTSLSSPAYELLQNKFPGDVAIIDFDSIIINKYQVTEKNGVSITKKTQSLKIDCKDKTYRDCINSL